MINEEFRFSIKNRTPEFPLNCQISNFYYHNFLILYHNYLYTKLFKFLLCLEIKTV